MGTPVEKVIERCVRPDVRAMHAYPVQDARGLVKLDAMENPYTLTQPLREVLARRLAQVELNRYPGEQVAQLRSALGHHVGMPAGYDLMLGNGSDELITLLAVACDQPGASILAPVPGFVMYELSARLQGLAFIGVDLKPDFQLDGAAMLDSVRQHRPTLVYLAYPNNPTATLWDDAVIESVIEAVGEQGGLVVMDEAYQPFAARSYIDRLHRHAHVLLMRTMSKFGLAGVRIGYLIGRSALIAELDKVRPPYNISVLNAQAALFALEHAQAFHEQAAAIRAERGRLTGLLRELPGVTAFPSEANMILVRVPDAQAAFAGLRERGVLVKNVATLHPLLARCLRLTVGTPPQNDQMVQALRAVLA